MKLGRKNIADLEQGPAGYVVCTILRKVKGGKKLKIQLSDGTELAVGGKALIKPAVLERKKAGRAKRQKLKDGHVSSDDEFGELGCPDEIWKASTVLASDWLEVEAITADDRAAKYGRVGARAIYLATLYSTLLDHFLAFFPLSEFAAVFERMQTSYNARWSDGYMQFNRGSFLRFLGVLLRFSIYNLPTKMYWEADRDMEYPEFFVSDVMNRRDFFGFWSALVYPDEHNGDNEKPESDEHDADPAEADGMSLDYIQQGFGKV